MSDTNAAAPPTAPTGEATPAAPLAAPVDTNADPQWLPARLARKEKEIAKALGFETIEEAKARIAKAAELETAQLSESEKAKARIKELEAVAAEHGELKSAVAAQAKAALEALTPEQRDAVTDIAGDSPAKQLKTIERLRPTWVAVAKPIPAPATTAPTTPAPAPTAPKGEDVLATYEQLAKVNPVAAATYRLANHAAYYAALNARGTK